jgi:predicted FMN-binding regulatory protein PaiB
MSAFEIASRLKLRFQTPKGQVSTEDLWDLPLQSKNANTPNLDDVAKTLNRSLRQNEEESFVSDPSPKDNETKLKLDIVKYIINVKKTENIKKLEQQEKAEQRKKIKELLASKKDQELAGKSPEELEKMLAELES